ncbi:hypothetical protein [Ruegeria arenilitoris]|uniref:hypothetical protein n=1 Tax=Ruegeria arenilitoris TaxID=1173585 RepID=UPI001480FF39|nr:hypothetical protein [Ruegeria arenilitoris]
MNRQHRHDAAYATMCSYLGLSARDVAEIGGFSDRFARDILAGRKSFPQDTKSALHTLLFGTFDTIVKAMKQDVRNGVRVIYIYRTNEQLRASPDGKIWGPVGKAPGGFVGPYRTAAFEVYRWASDPTAGQSTPIELMFPEASQAI